MDLLQFRQNSSAFRFYAVIVMVMLFMMFIGYRLALTHTQQSIKENQIKTGSIVHAQAENTRLVQELSQLNVQLAMITTAHELLQEDFSKILNEQKALVQQINLYQAVLGESNGTGPFAIHHAHIMALPEADHYILDLLLLQGRALKALINGNLTIEITGMQAGNLTTLNVAELMTLSEAITQSDTSMRYRYQYFLERQYVFYLPEGFTPESLSISTEVFQWKRKIDSFTRTFSWSDLIAPNT
ncbi:MAG: Uncharacterised protein [Glaciecola sp. HTCC2999]|nr:MAG: Uncharacterised protein [Glaciecola sp. HTCC2999]